MKHILKRFRSWALWLWLSAFVVFCVKEFGCIDISQKADGFMNVLLPVLVTFGIVNNPTDSKRI